jgi:hypothetical protein
MGVAKNDEVLDRLTVLGDLGIFDLGFRACKHIFVVHQLVLVRSSLLVLIFAIAMWARRGRPAGRRALALWAA